MDYKVSQFVERYVWQALQAVPLSRNVYLLSGPEGIAVFDATTNTVASGKNVILPVRMRASAAKAYSDEADLRSNLSYLGNNPSLVVLDENVVLAMGGYFRVSLLAPFLKWLMDAVGNVPAQLGFRSNKEPFSGDWKTIRAFLQDQLSPPFSLDYSADYGRDGFDRETLLEANSVSGTGRFRRNRKNDKIVQLSGGMIATPISYIIEIDKELNGGVAKKSTTSVLGRPATPSDKQAERQEILSDRTPPADKMQPTYAGESLRVSFDKTTVPVDGQPLKVTVELVDKSGQIIDDTNLLADKLRVDRLGVDALGIAVTKVQVRMRTNLTSFKPDPDYPTKMIENSGVGSNATNYETNPDGSRVSLVYRDISERLVTLHNGRAELTVIYRIGRKDRFLTFDIFSYSFGTAPWAIMENKQSLYFADQVPK